MTKKIEVTEGNKYDDKLKELRAKLADAEKELEAANEKVAGIKDEIQDLVEEYLEEKVVVAPVVVIEHRFPRTLWGLECWF